MRYKHLNKDYILRRVSEHRKEWQKRNPDKEWFFCAANGSMNYNLDTEDSDVDTKLVTIPGWSEILNEEIPTSTMEMENGEKCNVHDIRSFLKNLRKSNVNFVETLYSDYIDVNPKYAALLARLIAMRDNIAYYDPWAAIQCMQGMAHRYYKRLESGAEPDKALYHMMRMNYALRRFLLGTAYKGCICFGKDGTFGDWLIATKCGDIDWSKRGGIVNVANEVLKTIDDAVKKDSEYLKSIPAGGAIKAVMDDIAKAAISENLLDK